MKKLAEREIIHNHIKDEKIRIDSSGIELQLTNKIINKDINK